MSTLSQFFGGASGIPCELLVVGGGGASGCLSAAASSQASGGGGAGGLLYHSSVFIPKGVAHVVLIGAGGTSNVTAGVGSTNGTGSSFGDASVGGGGYGGYQDLSGSLAFKAGGEGGASNIAANGSGGGGYASDQQYVDFPGGAGAGLITSLNPTTIGEVALTASHEGGNGYWTNNPNIYQLASGGGGGAVGPGQYGASGRGGLGGSGYAFGITGTTVIYSSGGAGVSSQGVNVNISPIAGTANTGEGATGAATANGSPANGATGGSGVVIIAYPISYAAPASIIGTYTTPTRSGYRVYRFTGSGSITL